MLLFVLLSVGLEKNESIPDPELGEPRQPSTKEKENAVEITIAASKEVSESFTNLQLYCYFPACLVRDHCDPNKVNKVQLNPALRKPA